MSEVETSKVEALDYQPPAPSPSPKRTWVGVLTISAVGCGFVAWGIAASARRGPFPGELGMSSGLTALSLLLCVLSFRNAWRTGKVALVLATVAGIGVALWLSYLAIWNLSLCRW
jgi:hypothetical protein